MTCPDCHGTGQCGASGLNCLTCNPGPNMPNWLLAALTLLAVVVALIGKFG